MNAFSHEKMGFSVLVGQSVVSGWVKIDVQCQMCTKRSGCERVLNFVLTVCWWGVPLTKTNHSVRLIFTYVSPPLTDFFFVYNFFLLVTAPTLFVIIVCNKHVELCCWCCCNDQNSCPHSAHSLFRQPIVAMKLNIDWSFALIT